MNIKNAVNLIPGVDHLRNFLHDRKLYSDWIKNGRGIPVPYVYKRKLVKEFANNSNINIFIETGTYNGGMIEAVRKLFDKIYSIELDTKLYEKAVKRFERFSHIQILQGDSGVRLNDVLKKVNDRVIFWLDAHYSGGYTSRGDEDTPILKELKAILEHNIKNHIILIDDAREFNSESISYPTIQQVRNFIDEYIKEYDLSVEDDIIRITF